MNIRILLTALFCIFAAVPVLIAQDRLTEPVTLAISGLSHDHVHWIFGRENPGDIEIVGIYESNPELKQRYAYQYNLPDSLFYDDLLVMLDEVQPEAISAFGPTFDHLEVVEASAPRGINIMVEKPLAVSLEHAQKMQALAEQHDVHIITNYETTWYASNQLVYDQFHESSIMGNIKKIVVHDGHRGPKEIGVSEEFLEWLTDPVLNGGGAIMDFGCYGANLITWLHNGEEPLSVTAVTQTLKPDIYPLVDDEATIILTYPESQGIIQASWNWPYNRKDMHVYGESGYAYALSSEQVEILKEGDTTSEIINLQPRVAPMNDPFSYLAAVVRGTLTIHETDLSSLQNNVTVMKILDAARESAQSGKTIFLTD
jgi:predicted dehydrogenase